MKTLTILEALKKTEQYLKEKEISEPRANAEIMLAEILKCKRLDLYLKFEQPLSESEIAIYRNYLKRRSTGEPLQYILGNTEFFGLPFKVNPSVLIPRSETELLVEEVIKILKNNSSPKILDVGSGSGNIAISLAKSIPDARIVSVDISEEAIKTAEENSRLNEVDEKIDFKILDILNGEIDELDNDFDLIVSNPPYINADEISSLQVEVRNYEPLIALTDGEDGFKFFNRICELGRTKLKSNGIVIFELAKGQSAKVKRILEKSDYAEINIVKDYAGIDRIILGYKP